MLKCACGTVLKLSTGFTGADWDTEAGEGSGYGIEVSLKCNNCGRIYTIGHIKEYKDFTPVKGKHKCVN